MKSKNMLIFMALICVSMQMAISEFVEPHEHEIKHEWNSFKSTHSKKKRTFNHYY